MRRTYEAFVNDDSHGMPTANVSPTPSANPSSDHPNCGHLPSNDLQRKWRSFLTFVTLLLTVFLAYCFTGIGIIFTTGCFIGCDVSHPIAGALWFVGAASIAGGGTALNGAWWPYSRLRWIRTGVVVFLVVIVGVAVLAVHLVTHR